MLLSWFRPPLGALPHATAFINKRLEKITLKTEQRPLLTVMGNAKEDELCEAPGAEKHRVRKADEGRKDWRDTAWLRDMESRWLYAEIKGLKNKRRAARAARLHESAAESHLNKVQATRGSCRWHLRKGDGDRSTRPRSLLLGRRAGAPLGPPVSARGASVGRGAGSLCSSWLVANEPRCPVSR